ncbi:MAG: SIMPL domain-containing protein [Bacteroidota bacterium]
MCDTLHERTEILNTNSNEKIIIIFIFSIFTIPIFSQTNNGNEITAEGNSRTKVKPDLAKLRITIGKQNLVEKNAIRELNEEIGKLQKVLFKIGFTEKNIKISDYKVSSNENDGNKKEYFATNILLIDFALDNKLIEAFYQEIQNDNLKDLDIEFETQISEELEKATRQKLVQIAVADAKNNAENIAKALDVKINNVKQVSKYNLRDVAVSATKMDEVKFKKPMIAMAPIPKTSFDKFEVEEKELEETITIVYEIVKK